MKKTHLIAAALFGAATLSAVAWSSSRSATAPTPSSVPSAAPSAVAVAPAASVAAPVLVDAAGFRPSQFAGVSVRERPAERSASTSRASGGRAWVAVRPGRSGAVGTAVPKGASRGAVTFRKQKGTTRLGGDELVASGLLHATRATRTSKGRSVLQCVPGDGHDHAAHAGR